MYFTRSKTELTGSRFLTVELFEDFDRDGNGVILKLVQTLRVVEENVSIKDKYLGLVLSRFLFRQGSSSGNNLNTN